MSVTPQLTDPSNYDAKTNMVLGKPEKGTIPGSGVTFLRVKIGTKYDKDTVGDLILQTSRLYGYGVQENKNPEGRVTGHVFPLVMWDRQNPSEYEKQFTDTITNISNHCVDWLLDNRDVVEKYDLERGDLKKFNPLYFKKEKGKIIEGKPPTLYTKLMQSKKSGIISMFINNDTNKEVDAMTLLNTHCYAEAAIKIESIFIGNKISLQVKLYEAVVTPREGGKKSLLRPSAERIVMQSSNLKDALGGDDSKPAAVEEDTKEEESEEEDDASDGSLSGSDEEEEEEKPPTPKKKPITRKKVIRRKT